jgi:hypothetical protein
VSQTVDEAVLLRLGGDASSAALVAYDEEALHGLLEHYDEVLGSASPAGDGVSWQLPGLTVLGELPPVEFVRVVAEVAKTVPLQSTWGDVDPTPGFSLWVADGGVAPLYGLSAGDDVVVVAARAIVDAGVEPASFEHPTPAAYGAVHFGECPGGVADGQYDAEFIDALASEGVPVSTAANLGICERIAQ